MSQSELDEPPMSAPKRKMVCEWRAPVLYPLHTLINDLKDAIRRTELRLRVDPASRVRGWLHQLTTFVRRDFRGIAVEITDAIRENLTILNSRTLATAEDEARIVWRFPHQDAFRSLLDARMFVHVVRHLESKLHPLHWRALIQGNLRPEDDKQNTPHRDHLLELYIASAAEAAGMNVELSEPDIVVHIGGDTVGISVKRIKSRRQVLENAKKAARQIWSAGMPCGIVFLDVSNLMNQNMVAMRYIQEPGSKNSGTVHGNLMKFASEEVAIQQLMHEPHVEGIILRHAAPAMFGKSFIPATLETWSPIVDAPTNLTAAVYGGMLDALSPRQTPRLDFGLSGKVPSEFAYGHL